MDEWFLEAGGAYLSKGEKKFTRNIFISLDDIDNIRNKFNNTDVYVTAYMYDGTDEKERNLFAPFYLDMDTKIQNDFDYGRVKKDLCMVVTALNIHYKVPHESIKIYFSGNKGFHIIIAPEVFNIQPCQQLNEYFRYIACELKLMTLFKTIDTKIYDSKRLFRLPNSIHSETGLYKVPVDLEFVKSSTWNDMVSFASEPHIVEHAEPKLCSDAETKFKEAMKRCREAAKRQSRMGAKVFKNGFKAPCIKEMLDRGAEEGNRNNTTIILASSLMQNGKSYNETLKIINAWNDEKNSPKLTESEIKNTVNSARKELLGNKKFGCRSVKEAGYCEGVKCPMKGNA